MSLPPARSEPCLECPWVRRAAPGHLGPHSAQDWVESAHGDGPIACHETIRADESGSGDWAHPSMRQCAGAATFRANVSKLPRNPEVAVGPRNTEAVFASNAELIAHHDLAPRLMRLPKWMLEEWSGLSRSRNKAQMVDEILKFGSPHHHDVLVEYEHLKASL